MGVPREGDAVGDHFVPLRNRYLRNTRADFTLHSALQQPQTDHRPRSTQSNLSERSRQVTLFALFQDGKLNLLGFT